MRAAPWLIAALALAAAAPALAASPFDGVWQVERRGPGGPPPGGPGAGRPPPRGEAAGPALPETLAAMLDRGDRRTYSLMTPAGQAMFATFDPKKLPANNCRSPGLPSIAMTPDLQAWTVTGGRLSIHHEYFDTHREIGLQGAAVDGGALGRAAGRIEGGTLTIETRGAPADWSGLGRNAPSSDARVVHETYRLDGPDTLLGEIEVEDAKFLTQPLHLRVTLRRAPAGTKIETFPCDLAASQRDLGG